VTWLDAVIVVALLAFLITAFQSGFVREIIGFAATLGGLIAAGLFYDDIRDSFLSSIDNETAASAVAFLVIFLSIGVAGALLAMVINPMIHFFQLGMADQFLGAGFGLVKGYVVIVSLLVLFITYPVWDMDEAIADSEFATRLLNSAEPITNLLPDIFQSQVDAFTDGGEAPIRQS
jgi:membrane protein required for colicin V production